MFSFDDFVGKKIKMVLISEDKREMAWHVDDAWYSVVAEGDCCSYSWFEHCDAGDVLQDCTLTAFEDFSMDSKNDPSGYEVILINMLKFTTSKGYCTIEFRNSSNGYYSGWADIKLSKKNNYNGFEVLGDF
jgi:hypothetical protein